MTEPADLEKLKGWATVRQAQVLDAIITHGGVNAAGRALGLKRTTIQDAVKAARKKAALQGHAPEHNLTRTIPEPLVMKGVSTLYGAEGEVKLQWVKSQLDKTLAKEAIEEWVAWLVQDAKGLAPVVTPPPACNDDLLVVYPMGDPHYGLYAWAQETGEDFDLEIAERLTKGAIDRLVACAPEASTAIIAELGDFFHADNKESRTPTHGFALDTDSRWPKVMQIGLRSMVYIVLRALEKHRLVIVRIVAGNHDPHASFALALALDAFFSQESRVTVDLSAAPFWYYQFGKVLIGLTHGDTIKPAQLPGIMAADRAKEWGETKHRYWYTGHVHHQSKNEFPGVLHETFRTLAGRDAWHAGKGYRSGRDMHCIIHHKLFGEMERHRCDIAQLEAA